MESTTDIRCTVIQTFCIFSETKYSSALESLVENYQNKIWVVGIFSIIVEWMQSHLDNGISVSDPGGWEGTPTFQNANSR